MALTRPTLILIGKCIMTSTQNFWRELPLPSGRIRSGRARPLRGRTSPMARQEKDHEAHKTPLP